MVVKMMMALTGVSESHGIAMDPTQRLDFTISREGMTRITVENDGIEDMLVFPKEYSENIQKTASGHIFVAGQGIDRPISVTIITKRNIAQDLQLTAKSKKPEPIILTYTDPEAQKKEEQNKVSKALQVFLQGQTPSGYHKGSLHEASRSKGVPGGTLEAVAIVSYRNTDYVVTEFTVKNQGKEKALLNPATMWSEGDIAVVFNVESLESSSSFGNSDEAKMFVIRKLR